MSGPSPFQGESRGWSGINKTQIGGLGRCTWACCVGPLGTQTTPSLAWAPLNATVLLESPVVELLWTGSTRHANDSTRKTGKGTNPFPLKRLSPKMETCPSHPDHGFLMPQSTCGFGSAFRTASFTKRTLEERTYWLEMQREVGAWWCIRKKTYGADPFQKVLEERGKTVRSGIKKCRCEYHLRRESEPLSSLKCVRGPTASSCNVAVLMCPQSICKYCYSSPSPSPHPMWVREILEWHMNRHFSPQEKCKENKRKQQQHRIPFTMLRRSVLLMDTQASLEAKRTPDVWEGSPTLKWITLKQNILSQIGLCLNSLLLLGEGEERAPPAPWLVKDTGRLIRQTSLQTATYTLMILFLPQQSKYRVKHNWAVVLVTHNERAAQNRRKIEKSTLTKVSPTSLPENSNKGAKGRLGKITLTKLPDEVFMQTEWFWGSERTCIR